LSSADIAAHADLGTSTVKNYLNGLGANTQRVREEIERVLSLAERGEILGPGSGQAITVAEAQTDRVRPVAKKHEFYVTETVRRIGQVLDYCSEQSAIGVVTGTYGVGKTEAVSAWRRGSGRRVENLVFEFDEFSCANKISFISALADAAGMQNTRCGMNDGARMFRSLVAHLREHPCLLIFDQCESVRPRVFQVIRQIWDRTRDAGVGVALLAAPVLLSKLKSMSDLGALESRVGIYAPLAGLTRGEMASIVKQEGISDVDDGAFGLWWHTTEGSMRRLLAAVDLLKVKHQGKRVTEKTITGVAGHLWGLTVRTEAA
jgi:DNA transposition AAA+ family ATPase